jgi:hypothetical protein
VFQNDLGSLQVIDAGSLPILSTLSIKRLTLALGACSAREMCTSCLVRTRITSRTWATTSSTS